MTVRIKHLPGLAPGTTADWASASGRGSTMNASGISGAVPKRKPVRVSVVIPVYNAGESLREAVQSVLSQTLRSFEIILVDDGSTDPITQTMIRSFGRRVRVVRQPNAGPASARNLGISHASGEWIAFLDQDDLWTPEKLETQLNVAESTGADIIYTNARNFGELDRVTELRNDPSQMPSGDIFESLLLDNMLTMAGVIVRASLFRSVGLFRSEVDGVDDWDMWLRASAAGAQFAAVQKPLTIYRWHSASLSKRHEQMKEHRVRVLQHALSLPRGRAVCSRLKRRAWAQVLSTSAWFIAEKNPFKAVFWYLQSLFFWPAEAKSWKGIARTCLRRV
jgi:glycosyltransferase involved in cell wall biosynthesis